jgi:NitT/TauT family transport system substrate-binding protein
MYRKSRMGFVLGFALSLGAAATQPGAAAEPLKIGYSDWPGYVAWQVAIEKGWFKEAGVAVDWEWFDYSASMDAYTAGKIDADLVVNGDALVMGAGGGKSISILLTDYSKGADMIVGQPGINSLKDLKGKKVGIEFGLVEHLLLLNGLKKTGMSEEDITLVNTPTNDTPQVLASGEVAAIGAWQPNSGQAMKAVPGAHPIYTSADEPGLIYDVLAVNPTVLHSRQADWAKLFSVWQRVVAYINDPKTQDDAVKIMAARSGSSPEEYKPYLAGLHLINVTEGKNVFKKGSGFTSLYGSSEIADAFYLKNEVYKEKQDVDSYIDPTLIEAAQVK